MSLSRPPEDFKTSDGRPIRRRPRRPATAAERRQSHEVARFVDARNLAGQPLLLTLLLISRAFPEISLNTALCGVVFRELWLSPQAQLLLDEARGTA